MNPRAPLWVRWRERATRAWQVLMATMVLLALMLLPASYSARRRPALATQVLRATWPHCLWFTLLAALLGVVLIRIVVVTAQSYGLSGYALEMVVRVLVLELLPLMAALFVALRWSLPAAAEVAAGGWSVSPPEPTASASPAANAPRTPAGRVRATLSGTQLAWLSEVALARAQAGVFAVGLLVSIGAVLGLVLAYLLVHGFTPWALEAYTHMVGRVFSPVVALIFALKSVAFSLAVGLVPLASLVPGVGQPGLRPPPGGLELQGLLRLTGTLLLVELVSLLGNYY